MTIHAPRPVAAEFANPAFYEKPVEISFDGDFVEEHGEGIRSGPLQLVSHRSICQMVMDFGWRETDNSRRNPNIKIVWFDLIEETPEALRDRIQSEVNAYLAQKWQVKLDAGQTVSPSKLAKV